MLCILVKLLRITTFSFPALNTSSSALILYASAARLALARTKINCTRNVRPQQTMKLSFLLGTTLVSSALSFLPALFSIENLVKSPACQNRVCQKLDEYGFSKPVHHKINTLHGSWRLLKPLDPDSTTYQMIDYDKKYALTSVLWSNGTRVDQVMPFTTCRKQNTAFFVHAKQFTSYADDSRYVSTATCSSQSFELVYASTSIRVDRMVATGAFRVYVPCDELFVRH